jgi:penicillin-binding protein 1A
VAGEWYYEEYARNTGISSLGLEASAPAAPAQAPAPEERKQILDLFRN